MVAIRELRARAEQLLMPEPEPERVAATVAEPEVEARRARSFSPFDPDDLQRAVDLADRLMAIARVRGGTRGLADAIDDAERLKRRENPRLVEHAWLIFATHYRDALQLPIPGLIERRRGLFAERPARRMEAVDAEAALSYWREDPLANQHHEHWHVVYPWSGVPDGQGELAVKHRHGELFLYMHQQMLARYDAERLSNGLPPVVAYGDESQPLQEGYDPPDPGYPSRHPNQTPSTGDAATQATTRGRITADLAQSRILGSDQLGRTIEATFPEQVQGDHGGLHNHGHMVLAALYEGSPAIIADTSTAIMDPAFFRWHRHIDDLGAGFQTGLAPHDFADAPDIQLADSALLLCFLDKIPGRRRRTLDLQSWADTTFGGANWSTTTHPAATTQLETFMTTASSMGPRQYLDHREFVYVMRAENTTAADIDVTIRLFLAPTRWTDNRRAWIEMDKFQHRVPSNSKAVIARAGSESSVVQKAVHRPPQPRREPIPPGRIDQETNYCSCGWPYHLLLPRGTKAGLPCTLLAIVTDATVDTPQIDGECGSLSFCGARDVQYPDQRPMGYPFDRGPANGADYLIQLQQLPSVATVDVSILHS